VIFSEVTEKKCVKDRYPHSTAKVRIVQDCAAMSAMAMFLLARKKCPDQPVDKG